MDVSDQDLRSYFGSCIVTFDGDPCKVLDVTEGRFLLLNMLTGAETSEHHSDVNTHIPTLGWVKVGAEWMYMYRVPARRIKKGYCQETLGFCNTSGIGSKVSYDRTAILQQLWKKPRKHPEVLALPDGRIYYSTELVVDVGGVDVEGKEKLAGYVRSLA